MLQHHHFLKKLFIIIGVVVHIILIQLILIMFIGSFNLVEKIIIFGSRIQEGFGKLVPFQLFKP